MFSQAEFVKLQSGQSSSAHVSIYLLQRYLKAPQPFICRSMQKAWWLRSGLLCVSSQVKKRATIEESYARCDDLIQQFKENKLKLTAGCDMEGSLEAQVTGVLNSIRETASKVSRPPQRLVIITCT